MDELEDCLDQVYRMALAAMQSYTFWLYTRADDSPYDTAIQTYGHFFYATNEAHLTMMFISLDCLFDEKPRLVNLEKLLTLLPARLSAADCETVRQRVAALRKRTRGIGIIRNNCFAHLSSHETREDIGRKYGVSNGELMVLCYSTLDLVTEVLRMLGREGPDAGYMVAKDAEAIQSMLGKLQSDPRSVEPNRRG